MARPRKARRSHPGSPDTVACTKCKQDKPLAEFYNGVNGGQTSMCIECYAGNNRARLAAETPVERLARIARNRDNWFKSKYGITASERDRHCAEQGGLCAVCQQPPSGDKNPSVPGNKNTSSLHVDHDHETGRFRGLLCRNCNTALGLLRDDCDVIWGLLLYMRKHEQSGMAARAEVVLQ